MSLYQSFAVWSKFTNYYWYYRYLHVPKFLVLLYGLYIYLSFRFLLILLCGLQGRQSWLFGRFSFLLAIAWSGCLAEIRWPEKFVRLIFQYGFWVVHIPHVHMVKFKFLTQVPVDYQWIILPPSRILSHTLFFFLFAGFDYKLIDCFVIITT